MATFAAVAVAPRAITQQQPAFSTTSDLVVVHALVLSHDKPVVDLTAEDFRITEDGEERPVSVFIPPSWTPGEVVVALDVSNSSTMWPSKEAAGLLLDSLHPRSCVLLMPFGETVLNATWGRAGDPQLRRLVADQELTAEEAIFDALIVAIEQLKERAAARGLPLEELAGAADFGALERELERLRYGRFLPSRNIPHPVGDCEIDRDSSEPAVRQRIVLITDGDDHESQASVEDALLAAWGSGIPLFILAAEPGYMSNARLYATLRGLSRLTEFTGGALFRGVQDRRDHRRVRDAVLRLIGGLRAHYVLGYIPAPRPDAAPLVERDLRIDVRKPNHEVLAPSRALHGPAKARHDALETARRGFRQIDADQTGDALATFERARAIDPDLGPAHYGRGIASEQLGQLEEALADFGRAAALDPWLPGLDARRAELAIATGDLEQAWSHVMSALAAGLDVSDLVERLQRLAPREVTLREHRGVPRVSLQAQSDDSLLVRTSVVPALLAATGREVWNSPAMTLAREGQEAEFSLLLDLDDVSERGRRVSVRGWLVLRDREGDKVAEVRLVLGDALSQEEYLPALEAAIRQLEEGIRTR